MTKLEQQPLEKRKTPVVRRVTILRDRASAPGLLPATVLGWIPFWWSRVLFPGQSDSHRASRWHTALLILLPGLLLYPCLGFHLFEPDEGRYAQIPREMLTHNEWIVPTLQSEPYLDKPPLFYWTVMLAFSVFGYHTWTARLVPALATHGAILVTYFLGRRLVGARPAFWGALILSLAPAFIGVSRLLLLDGLLTLFTTTAILAAYVALRGATLHRGWWYLAALAGGFALLTKGPVAVVLLVPPLWLTRRLEPYRCPLPWRHVLGFLGVVFAVNVPWYAAILLREPEFGWYFFVQHNLQRFVDPFDHERPVSFFVPIVLFGMLPATLLLPAAVRFLFSSRPEATRQRSLPLGHLLLSGLWCFLFFSLSGSKLPTYILPAFPPLALALGCYIASGRVAASRWTITVAAAWSALMLVTHWVIVPGVAEARSPIDNETQIEEWCGDPAVPVYSFPRTIDSVAFHLGRSDVRSFRSKDMDKLIAELARHPRSVVLFGHRNSLETMRRSLPLRLRIVEEAPLGLCKMAKVERR